MKHLMVYLSLLVLAPGISSAAAFKRVGGWFGPTNAPALTVSLCLESNIAYCLLRNSGVAAVDVSNPQAPAMLGFAPLDGEFQDIKVNHGIVFASSGILFNPSNTVITAVNFQVPQNPQVLATITDSNSVFDVAYFNNTIYFVDPFNVMRIFDVQSPSSPLQLAHYQYEYPRIVNDLAISSNSMFVADSLGLSIFTLTNPAVPAKIGEFLTPYYGFETEVVSNTAYFATDDLPNKKGRLHILSLTNLAAPVETGSFEFTNFFSHEMVCWSNYLILQPSYLFHPGPYYGLIAYDVSDPTNAILSATYMPQSVGYQNFYFGQPIAHAEVAGDYVYTVGAFGLEILRLDLNEFDTDHDGLFDSWELANGLDPNDPADRDSDTDGDGATAYQEYVAGTNPTNALSSFKITSTVTTNAVTLAWPSVAGRTYGIYRVPNLDSEFPLDAVELVEVVPATPPQNTYTISINLGDMSGFYFLDVFLETQ